MLSYITIDSMSVASARIAMKWPDACMRCGSKMYPTLWRSDCEVRLGWDRLGRDGVSVSCPCQRRHTSATLSSYQFTYAHQRNHSDRFFDCLHPPDLTCCHADYTSTSRHNTTHTHHILQLTTEYRHHQQHMSAVHRTYITICVPTIPSPDYYHMSDTGLVQTSTGTFDR